jgi:hypothetical protein
VSWAAPPTFIAGTVFTAANANILSGDLTVLATQIGLLGAGPAVQGSPPAATAPNFSLQTGSLTGTTSGGAIGLVFPTSFPNGVFGVIGMNGDSSVTNMVPDTSQTTNPWTKTGGTFFCRDFTGALVGSVAVRINWIAGGF